MRKMPTIGTLADGVVSRASIAPRRRRAAWLICIVVCGAAPWAEPSVQPHITLLAEVRVPSGDHSDHFRWAPASRIEQGQEVFYTVRIRNPGRTPMTAVSLVRRLPDNMHYVANSATGAGAAISFSADGGRHFARPEELLGPGDPARLIPADQYTHIRWQLRHPLAPQAVVLARFRAVFQ